MTRTRSALVIACFAVMTCVSLAGAERTFMSLRGGRGEQVAEDEMNSRCRGRYIGSPVIGVAGALAGDSDGAVQFTGDGGYVRVPHAETAMADFGTKLDRFSVEYWYRSTEANLRRCVLGTINHGANTALQIEVDQAGAQHNLLLRSQQGYENMMRITMSPATSERLRDGSNHHVVWVVEDAKTGAGAVYVDGEKDTAARTEGQCPTGFVRFEMPLAIGASNVRGDVDQFIQATLDELALYDWALTADQVATHYRTAIDAEDPGYSQKIVADKPYAYWRFGDYRAEAFRLLLDHRVVESTKNAALKITTATKHPANPLFSEEHPWEVMYNNMYPNVIWDNEEKIYKAWISMFIKDNAYATTPPEDRTPGTYMKRTGGRIDGEGYAVSRDGLRWEKPMMDIVRREGRKSNLVATHVHGAGIMKDPRERDPMRRYKMFFRGQEMAVRFSPDGLDWGPFIGCPEIAAAGDAHNNTFWAPELGKYVGITRKWGADRSRVVGRTESADYIHWTKAAEVFRGKKLFDIYSMPVIRYGNVYLGLASIFNEKTDRVWVELAWSPDTVKWHRVDEGTPLIANSGTKGAYDWGTVYASFPIVKDGEVRLYYGGGDGRHFDWRRGYLCLATLKPDRFAGYQPIDASRPASVTTHPLTPGSSLRITADARDGQIVVYLLDRAGNSLRRSRPITGEATDAPVSWGSDVEAESLSGKEVRLQFILSNAKLYSFLW